MGDIGFFAFFSAPTVLYLICTRFAQMYDILLMAVVNVFFMPATGVVWKKLFPGGSVAEPLLGMWLGFMARCGVGTGTHRLKRSRAAELEAKARQDAVAQDDANEGKAD